MVCPNPLDPLCVAIMLRLSSGPADGTTVARDLEVAHEVVQARLSRLSSIGVVEDQRGSGEYSLLPEATKIIMRLSEPGLTQREPEMASRDEPGFSRRRARLQEDPMFRELSDEDLTWMTRVSRDLTLIPGEVLLLEDDECQGLYIVDSGTIRLSKGSGSSASGFGREQTIRLMGPGDSFNEVPVFDGGTNPVTAEAIEHARVIMVPKAQVQDLIRRSSEFSNLMIQLMSQHLRHMLAMVEDVSMRDVTGRVAKILLQAQHPAEGVGAGLLTGRRLTQREIAEMAGTAREVVARALKKMERAGAVRVNRGDVTILDPDLLRSFT